MDNIIILDDALINKIAAGEVIERPASVVKELIENAIDADAKKIFIELKEGGKSYLKVSDDGNGMSRRDVELSWHRHSTSKIKNADDLFSINSLGFRGEALASIAAVSELIITSKPENEISGRRIIVRGSRELINETIGCPKGTTVEVKNLFYNTPARKKYLKSINIELRHVTDIVTRYALINPKIHFRLIHNNREILDVPSTKDFLTNITFIYGKKIIKHLLLLEYSDDFYKINGYISKPSLSKSTKADQSIYVNKRYIKNTTISNAVNQAYHTLMMVNRYPVVILNININPRQIDVNVHPQKSEIRIHDEKQLYESVFDAVTQTLQKNDLIPETLTDELVKKLTDFRSFQLEELTKDAKYYNIQDNEQKLLVKETDDTSTSKLPEMKILGILQKTYILAETPGNLILIDQHAAAERILYEKFTEQLKNKQVDIQRLLDPVILKLTPKQYNIALDKKDFLRDLGYRYEEFGKNTLLIRTIPIVLGKQFDRNLFIDFIDELEKNKKPVSLEMFFHNKIAKMACRTAIKAGDEITLPQIKQYIKELSQKNIPYTCPHGRPIMIKWSFYELEKMFKRIV